MMVVDDARLLMMSIDVVGHEPPRFGTMRDQANNKTFNHQIKFHEYALSCRLGTCHSLMRPGVISRSSGLLSFSPGTRVVGR